MNFFIKAAAFIKKSFIIQKNYPLQFFIVIFDIVLGLAFFYFLTKMLGQDQEQRFGFYGGGLFTFFLIGMAYAGFLYTWLYCFSDMLQNEFYSGTLEVALATPTGIFQILFFSSLWPQLYAFLNVFLYFIIGILIFGARISAANYPLVLTVTLVSMVAFAGLGITSAALLIVFKKGDLLKKALYVPSLFLSGVYFPVEALPGWLQKISSILPATYSLRAIRNALGGNSAGSVYGDIGVLAIFAAILFPAGIYIFKRAFLHSKKVGSLTSY
ncbi:MAG: ABC transporter permease [Candidatus Omnitrophota bacterium]